MIRKIVKINEEKCTGCGLCIGACHEGALKIVDGKAKLISDSYCDGLGNCLPECPTGAITIVEREAAEFDEEAVKLRIEAEAGGRAGTTGRKAAEVPDNGTRMAAGDEQAKSAEPETRNASSHSIRDALSGAGGRLHEPENVHALKCGCPGTHARVISRNAGESTTAGAAVNTGTASGVSHGAEGGMAGSTGWASARFRMESQLAQWPCQIRLVPVNAPYFNNAHLLVAADCTAYAYANIHQEFMRNRITIIGCPKLDDEDYSQKFAAILACNSIKSITILRMEVPCCGGIVNAVKNAIIASNKMIPWNVITISTDGRVLDI